MIVPSIDLQGGQTVQLIGGRELELEAGDPRPLALKFGRVGEIAVIDLDAATEEGSNQALLEDVLQLAPCRVGGGIRSAETARSWLDRGAEKVILGTAARPEVLAELPRERVIAAVDSEHGEVVVRGWREQTGVQLEDKLDELKDHVGGFLLTFVEREGRLGGVDLQRVAGLVERAHPARVTIAGGVSSAAEVAALDRLGADAQVGMALYKGQLTLAECLSERLTSDRQDGLFPTVVCDEQGQALGLCYSNRESLEAALEEGRGVYWSRRRGLWRKGETSGATQALLKVELDCDADALRFTVRQRGPGFCHLERDSCWGQASGLGGLERTIRARRDQAPAGSYTRRLFEEEGLLEAKLVEEARELVDAGRDPEQVAQEAADVLYFTLTTMARADVRLADVERILAARARRVTRRPGNRKDAP